MEAWGGERQLLPALLSLPFSPGRSDRLASLRRQDGGPGLLALAGQRMLIGADAAQITCRQFAPGKKRGRSTGSCDLRLRRHSGSAKMATCMADVRLRTAT
jgi:hypothetical protein